VFLTTLDGRLIALDARTGERCAGFADVDLREGVEPLVQPRELALTSPGTVVGDLFVVGSSVPDLIRANAGEPGSERPYLTLFQYSRRGFSSRHR
jgi:quinoprotein glucose dehydrogenase